MQKRRNATVMGTAGLFAALMALACLWLLVGQPAQEASAQDGVTPGTNTVTAPWGVITTSSETNPGGIGTIRPPSGGFRSRGFAGTPTPVTTDHIDRPSGYIRVTFTPNADHNPVAYKLERLVTGLAGGGVIAWRTLEERTTATRYRDSDVAANFTYVYRITPILADDTTLVAERISHYAWQRVFLYGVGTTDGVRLTVRKSPNHSRTHQSVTITRYNNVELTNGHTVLQNHTYNGEHVHIADGRATLGRVYYYHMQISWRLDADEPWQNSPMNIDPVAVKAGVSVPIRPTQTQVTIDQNNLVTVSWSVPDDDEQALLYEVRRRPIKPINLSTSVPLGTTTRKTFKYVTDTPLTSYEYTVVPLNMARQFVTPGSDGVTFPTLPLPLCYNPLLGINSNDVAKVYIFRDITKADPDRLNRTFDVFGTDEHGSPCVGLNPIDFYMERWINFKHTLAPEQCVDDPSQSCDMGDAVWEPLFGVIEPQWPTEIVYGADSHLWGVWKWRALAFTDNTLPAGKYKMRYRVCAVGFSDLCSHWEASGTAYVGITSETPLPFSVAPPVVDEERDYGTGILTSFPF